VGAGIIKVICHCNKRIDENADSGDFRVDSGTAAQRDREANSAPHEFDESRWSMDNVISVSR
jgi:hypothetical protein